MKTAIVIGGGIAGCSTAHALAKRGIATTLIERQPALAQAGSGNPVGILYPKVGVTPSLIDQFTLQGFDFTRQLLRQTNQPTLYDFCGILQLAHHPNEQPKQQAQLQHHPTRIQSLSAQQASDIAGVPVSAGGIYWPEAGWLRPRLFCEHLSRHPLIRCVVDQTALSITPQTQQWRVDSAQSQYEADIVVICNAIDIAQFPQCRDMPITSVRGQINFANANTVSTSLKTVICGDHFIAPAVEGMHCFGTSYARNRTDAALCEADTHDNYRALRQLSPNLYDSFAGTSFSGRVAWRTATRDYVPLTGMLIDAIALREQPPRYNANPATLPWLAGLYVNAGHGSKGMITAPLCAEYIASMVNEETPTLSPRLAAKISPNRFVLRELGLKQLAQTLYG